MAKQLTHEEQRIWLIEQLLSETDEFRDCQIPNEIQEQKNLLRALMNVRPPKERAAEIAIQTVKDYLDTHSGIEKVVFNVFSDSDRCIYETILNEKI